MSINTIRGAFLRVFKSFKTSKEYLVNAGLSEYHYESVVLWLSLSDLSERQIESFLAGLCIGLEIRDSAVMVTQ